MNKTTRMLLACGFAALLFVAAMRPSRAFLDKTRFVTDLGVAFFAFHHWVWAPYHSGDFNLTKPHHVKAMVKGGVALLFAYNRVKAADHLAHVSKSPLLHHLAGAIDKMQNGFHDLGLKLKAGKMDGKMLSGVNASVTALGEAASHSGMTIKDHSVPIPGI